MQMPTNSAEYFLKRAQLGKPKMHFILPEICLNNTYYGQIEWKQDTILRREKPNKQ